MARSGSTTTREPRPSQRGQAPCGPLNSVFEHDSVDDHVEVVGLLPVDLEIVSQVDHGVVHARPDEALAAQPLELQLQLALPAATDGSQHAEARSVA